MEPIYHIRYEYFHKGKSIREIARDTGHDRKTIRKYLKKENFTLQMPARRKRKSKTDPYREQVRAWLILDQTAPRKQRHTAKHVYDRLVEQDHAANRPFDVSERSIRTLVAELKQELGQHKLVSLPLLHPAGEAQVDFGETQFYEEAVLYKGYHLALTLPHSDAKFVQLFKGQNVECLAQGLCTMFKHIGFVPRVIRFDNMSTAVKAIKAHGEREITDAFRRVQCHFSFESNFCNPASGHEKGSVENYVGYSRRNYFVPVPHIHDLVAFNRRLLEKCDKELDDEHYKLDVSKRRLFEEDKACMLPLPRYDFDVCRYTTGKTNQYGMVTFQHNSYSTAGNLAKAEVTLKYGAHHVTILDDKMRSIVSHKRLYGKKKESMIWGPYLSVLAQRPHALKYSGFFRSLPEPVRQFLGDCDYDEKKQVLKIVSQTSAKEGIDKSIAALSDAIKLKPNDADSLIAAYSFILNKPKAIPKNEVPDYIPKLVEYELDFSAYANLMGGTRCQKR